LSGPEDLTGFNFSKTSSISICSAERKGPSKLSKTGVADKSSTQKTLLKNLFRVVALSESVTEVELSGLFRMPISAQFCLQLAVNKLPNTDSH